MKRVHLLFLRTGYVESCSTAILTFFHPNGFDSVENALLNIGDAFITAIKQFKTEIQKRGLDVDDLSDAPSVYEQHDELQFAIVDFMKTDADSGGFIMNELFDVRGWDLWLSCQQEYLSDAVLINNADAIIAHLMFYDSPSASDAYGESVSGYTVGWNWSKDVKAVSGIRIRHEIILDSSEDDEDEEA